jgi:hypothetical protein
MSIQETIYAQVDVRNLCLFNQLNHTDIMTYEQYQQLTLAQVALHNRNNPKLDIIFRYVLHDMRNN